MLKSLYHPGIQTLIFFENSPPNDNRLREGTHVFVCGALQNPKKTGSLLGSVPSFTYGAVKGFHRGTEMINNREIPFMLPSEGDPDKVLTGIVWLDLSGDQLSKIEALELENNYRKRIRLPVQIGELQIEAFTYVKK